MEASWDLVRKANRTFAAALTVAALWWATADLGLIVDIADGDTHPTGPGWGGLVIGCLLTIALAIVAARQWRRQSRIRTKLVALGVAVAYLVFSALPILGEVSVFGLMWSLPVCILTAVSVVLDLKARAVKQTALSTP